MKRTPWWKSFLNIWVLGGGLILAILAVAIAVVILQMLRPVTVAGGVPTAVQTVIAAPTYTPVVVIPTAVQTPTPTNEAMPPSNDAINTGAYVQVIGTGEAGLRMRSDASTTASVLMVGLENEVFIVQDGPKEADGYTWWYLVNPYDTTKGGWAVSNYLTIIQKP